MTDAVENNTVPDEMDAASLARLSEELAAADEAALQERRDKALFHNVTVVDKDDIGRLIALTINQTRGMWLYRIFIMLFGAFFVVSGVVTLIEMLISSGGFESILPLAMLLLGVLLIWYGLKGIIKRTQKRMVKQAEGFIGTREFTFFENGFDYRSNNHTSPVAWHEISKTVEDERSIYLHFERAWLIVHIDGFTKGKVDDFRSLIADKVQVKKQRFW